MREKLTDGPPRALATGGISEVRFALIVLQFIRHHVVAHAGFVSLRRVLERAKHVRDLVTENGRQGLGVLKANVIGFVIGVNADAAPGERANDEQVHHRHRAPRVPCCYR